MFLNQEQLNNYHKNGFLILENQFSLTEIDILRKEITQLLNDNRSKLTFEKSGAVRTVFSPHLCSKVFRVLKRSNLITKMT